MSLIQESGFDPRTAQRPLLAAWEKFVEEGAIDADVVPPHIAESWVRARERKIDPLLIPSSAYLEPVAYEKRKAANRYFISIAKPFMENIYKYLEQSSYLVVLYDRDGYHLLRIGQRADFERGYQMAIREGLCFDETVLGTTGFSLAKRHCRPIQITGCEHYTALLHHVVGGYTPINDPIGGGLMGIIGVTTARTKPNSQTLALSAAAATAIEHSLRLDHGRKTFLFYWKALQTAMDNLSDGVFLVDIEGRFLEVNSSAREIFGLGDGDVKGKHVTEVLRAPDLEKLIVDVLLHPDREGKEADVEVRDGIYLASIKYARGEEGRVQGVMVQLKNVKNLSKVFQQIAGDQPRYGAGSMVGSGPGTRKIKELAQLAAGSDGNVIIEGESGTGKEVLAHMVHAGSPRSGSALVVINCSAIPSELMESTLFGHEKGAFTGALHTHIGKFELADRGTVFLDEIGEMPLTMQAKLLRVLEENKIERVGGKKPIKIDIRVIAATNRDLAEEVRLGRFRGDLFYRLNVFRVKISPLRERMEEIREFVPAFIGQMSAFFNKTIERISEDYYDALAAHDWPGNIRELRNAVRYSLTLLDGTVLRAAHLAGFFGGGAPGVQVREGVRIDPSLTVGHLSDIERTVILKSLEIAGGNKAKAAKQLGIGRATLYRKLKGTS